MLLTTIFYFRWICSDTPEKPCFVLVLLPMIESRIQATGQDGLTSHIFSGTNYVSNTLSGTFEEQDRTEFFKDGILNSILYLGWITIPIWILFLPYGVLKYFKKLNFQKSLMSISKKFYLTLTCLLTNIK